MKKLFDACGITVDDPTNLPWYLKASNTDEEEIFLGREEEILMNDVEDINKVMLDNIFVG